VIALILVKDGADDVVVDLPTALSLHQMNMRKSAGVIVALDGTVHQALSIQSRLVFLPTAGLALLFSLSLLVSTYTRVPLRRQQSYRALLSRKLSHSGILSANRLSTYRQNKSQYQLAEHHQAVPGHLAPPPLSKLLDQSPSMYFLLTMGGHGPYLLVSISGLCNTCN